MERGEYFLSLPPSSDALLNVPKSASPIEISCFHLSLLSPIDLILSLFSSVPPS